jgi:hydroxypyruvate reductase
LQRCRPLLAKALPKHGFHGLAQGHVAPDTLARALAKGLKLDSYLDRNDAFGCFDALGDLLRTGPIYTNVNDFRVLLIL